MRIALVLLVVLQSLAHAGKVEIRDDVGLLSATDRQDIEEAAGSIPFDVRVLVSQSAQSRSAFESMVSAEVTTPRVLAIGLDPTRRQTVARFGSGLAVPSVRWSAITEAGNVAFRGKEWGRGIALIATTGFAHKTRRCTFSSPAAHLIRWATGQASGRRFAAHPPRPSIRLRSRTCRQACSPAYARTWDKRPAGSVPSEGLPSERRGIAQHAAPCLPIQSGFHLRS